MNRIPYTYWKRQGNTLSEGSWRRQHGRKREGPHFLLPLSQLLHLLSPDWKSRIDSELFGAINDLRSLSGSQVPPFTTWNAAALQNSKVYSLIDRISCIPGWPQTPHVAKNINLIEYSASQVPGRTSLLVGHFDLGNPRTYTFMGAFLKKRTTKVWNCVDMKTDKELARWLGG